MAPRDLEEQLVKYLTDAHSIEQQALAQMRAAPKLAGDPRIAQIFEAHLTETQGHEHTVSELLERHGASPSKLKDIVGTLTGVGFGAFAAAQPDTPGKLIAHAFSYEHMEEAAYHLLGPLAEQAGDAEAVASLREIERQEHDMGERVAGCFDAAVTAALRDLGTEDLQDQLVSYLTDAHAIEEQSLKLLEKGPKLAGVPALATIYEQHLQESREHQRLLEAELDKHDVAPAKIAAFSYAFEHLEIAAYELLMRVAQRAGSSHVEALAGHIAGEERAAADKIWNLLGDALQASLQEQDVAA